MIVDLTNRTGAVSCATSKFCVAIDGIAGDVVSFDGSKWNKPVLLQQQPFGGLTAISCPTSSFCVDVDALGHAFRFDGAH